MRAHATLSFCTHIHNHTTHSRGYVTQLVYICLTCRDQAQARASSTAAAASSAAAAGQEGQEGDGADADALLHGICVSCAHNCHGILGHNLQNIGEKRAFRCGALMMPASVTFNPIF